MPRTIHVLPDAVANQIAAGEVVERPASVVKELVENALDAGASRVEIQIEGGGKRSIRVADDGAGMGREDALLSLDRHATSKIRSADDLRGVGTFGFRGEALPSIASVSRFLLETRPPGEEAGTRIRAAGGRIVAVEDVARRPGTTVTVETLFLNAPARARFLRTPAAEARAVSEALVPLALANPGVAFLLRSGERVLLDLPGVSELGERIAGVWGEEASASLIPIAGRRDGISVRGLTQRPDATRPGFRRAAFFVGRRPFRESALVSAVDRAYRTTVPPDHRPWVVAFLDAAPGTVDVNVHPTKAEVRFRDRAAIEQVVEEAVRRALEGEDSAAVFGPPGAASDAPRGSREGRSAGSGAAVVREGPGQMTLFTPGAGSDADPADGLESTDGRPPSGDTTSRAADRSPAAPREADGAPEAAAAGHAESAERPGDDLLELGRPRLWQVHRSWILAEMRDGLLLIDQHAAHERVLFERIMERFEREGTESQRLLFPLTIRLTPAEYELVQDLKGLLHRAGFDVEGFGGDTVIVHAVPDPHPHFDAERCLREMIEELTRGSELLRSARSQHERVAMSFACKAAIKSGQELDAREMQELVDQLFATELPFHDVHGRPTTVRLSRAELERKFGR